MIHAILHLLGIDTQQSYYYDFWSGIGTQIALVIGITSAYKHKNCHVKKCWRLGHPDPAHGWPACQKHHSQFQKEPDEPAAR